MVTEIPNTIYTFDAEPKLPRRASRQARMDHALWEMNASHDAVAAILEWLRAHEGQTLGEVEQGVLTATLGKAESLFSSACEDIDALKTEMEEWRDNMEQYFGSTEKFQIISDTAETLDNAVDSIENIEDDVWTAEQYFGADRDLDALEEVSQAIGDLCSEIETAEFPGAR